MKENDIVMMKQDEYRVIRLLGHGKGGYSYLVENNNTLYVLKKIHHEPCDYYQFGNKMAAEINDYERLKKIGIVMPKMICFDLEKEIIIKEYIDGPTIAKLLEREEDISQYLKQIEDILPVLYKAHLNIDYYPTNFVVAHGIVFYIDYECNEYDEKWDFEHWGKKYWLQ